MNCPKCASPMEPVTFDTINVDRCTHCHGIWFDMREQEHLRELAGSEGIDTGSPQEGREYDKIGDVHCPVCHVPMIRMVDSRQPHIWYESCPVCYGVFFDAGEFTDYKDRGLADFFKDLAARERP